MVSRYNFTVPLCISQTTGVSVVLVQRFKNHPSSMPQSEVALCLGLPGLTGPTLRCQAFATCLHKSRAVHPGNPQTSRQHTSLCADAHWTCPKKSDKLTGFAQRLGVHPPRCRHGLHGHLHALQNKLESRLCSKVSRSHIEQRRQTHVSPTIAESRTSQDAQKRQRARSFGLLAFRTPRLPRFTY